MAEGLAILVCESVNIRENSLARQSEGYTKRQTQQSIGPTAVEGTEAIPRYRRFARQSYSEVRCTSSEGPRKQNMVLKGEYLL